MTTQTMTHEFAAARQVPFTAYDLDYIWELPYGEGDLLRVDIHPVTIFRYGVNHEVGATAPSISVLAQDGRRALASVDMFYGSIEDAGAAAAEAMAEAAENPSYDKLKDRNAELKARIAELEKPRLYVLGLSDNGCEQQIFMNERDRLEFLVKQDDCIDDWYLLDVFPSHINFNLVGVGEDAQEELDNLED